MLVVINTSVQCRKLMCWLSLTRACSAGTSRCLQVNCPAASGLEATVKTRDKSVCGNAENTNLFQWRSVEYMSPESAKNHLHNSLSSGELVTAVNFKFHPRHHWHQHQSKVPTSVSVNAKSTTPARRYGQGKWSLSSVPVAFRSVTVASWTNLPWHHAGQCVGCRSRGVL